VTGMSRNRTRIDSTSSEERDILSCSGPARRPKSLPFLRVGYMRSSALVIQRCQLLSPFTMFLAALA
jgi:hypothetical protein